VESPGGASVRVVEFAELGEELSPEGAERVPSEPGRTKPVARARIARAVREILSAIGEAPDRPGLRETPERVARTYEELFAGLAGDPGEVLAKSLGESYAGTVALRDIPLFSICEHHLLPFVGVCHIAYAPDGKVVGLSKLARMVELLARRPQVQERLTEQAADAIMEHLGARGAAVRICAVHSCMTIRGVHKPGTSVVTTTLRGVFRDDPASRAEVLALFDGGGAGE